MTIEPSRRRADVPFSNQSPKRWAPIALDSSLQKRLQQWSVLSGRAATDATAGSAPRGDRSEACEESREEARDVTRDVARDVARAEISARERVSAADEPGFGSEFGVEGVDIVGSGRGARSAKCKVARADGRADGQARSRKRATWTSRRLWAAGRRHHPPPRTRGRG